MSEINNNTSAVNSAQQESYSQINMMELLYKFLDKWYYFAAFVVFALVIAFLVNRYAPPKYEATTSLLIQSNDDVMKRMDMQTIMGGSSAKTDLQNAIVVLQSFTMAKNTVKAMGLYCDYYQRINFRNVDIYGKNPFEVILDSTQRTQPVGVLMKIQLTDSLCMISYDGKDGVFVYDYKEDALLEDQVSIQSRDNLKLHYDKWYNLDGMRFKVRLNSNWGAKAKDGNYSFMINNFDNLAKSFGSYTINLISKESSIVDIKFRHTNKKKTVDFVNTLCKIYISETFAEKNYLNDATIDFVNSQINSIGDSLLRAEAKRESFQQSNNTLNLTNDGQYLYTKTNELQTRKAEEYTRQQYYKYLSDYLKNSEITEGIASPSVMGVTDMNLNGLIDQLTAAIISYKTAVDKRTAKNPKTKELIVTIETLRKQISESLINLKNVSDINMRELQRQQNELQVQIDKLPSTERSMISIERQFKFNDEIYNFLYQKRSEAEIAKNAALPDHKVIDKANTAIKVSPKNRTNYGVAFILGLLLPGLYIFVRYVTKNTVDSKDDLEKISDNPVFGYIPEFPKEYNRMIVFDKPRSQITEAYRSIRTNVKYVLNDDISTDGKAMLVTSSMPGEGKSLTAFNIASVFSISGNKTLLVEYDLRKPRLHKMLNLDGTKGISSYYIGQTSIEDSVQHTEFDNLDVLCVGPIPPNPSEIIDSQRNRDLIKELRKRYEYIILDTPPVNLIADAQTLAKEADVSLYVVRLGITSSGILNMCINEMENRSGVKVKFIVNGVKTVMQKYGYGGKGYGYGGYGYGYGGYGYGGYGKSGGYGYGYGYGDFLKENSYGYFDEEASEQEEKKEGRQTKNNKSEKNL